MISSHEGTEDRLPRAALRPWRAACSPAGSAGAEGAGVAAGAASAGVGAAGESADRGAHSGRRRGRCLRSLGHPGLFRRPSICRPSVPRGLRCLRRLGRSVRLSQVPRLGHACGRGRWSGLRPWRDPGHLRGHRGRADHRSARHRRRDGAWHLDLARLDLLRLGLPRLGSLRFGRLALSDLGLGDLGLGDRRPTRARPLMAGPPAAADRTVARPCRARARQARAKPRGTGARLAQPGTSMARSRMARCNWGRRSPTRS